MFEVDGMFVWRRGGGSGFLLEIELRVKVGSLRVNVGSLKANFSIFFINIAVSWIFTPPR